MSTSTRYYSTNLTGGILGFVEGDSLIEESDGFALGFVGQ